MGFSVLGNGISINSLGYIARSNITITRTNGVHGVYTFPWTKPHPGGSNYIVLATAKTGCTSAVFPGPYG